MDCDKVDFSEEFTIFPIFSKTNGNGPKYQTSFFSIVDEVNHYLKSSHLISYSHLPGMFVETAPPPPTPSPLGSCVGRSRLRIAGTSSNPSKVNRSGDLPLD